MNTERITFRTFQTVLLLFLPISELTGQSLANAGFEIPDPVHSSRPASWHVGGTGYDLALDTTWAHGGSRSLRIRSTGGGTFGVATQLIEAGALKGQRVRLSGYIRTEAVKGGWAGLWLRFDGPGGALWMDNMIGRGAVGTSEWTRFRVEGVVPDTATGIALGAIMPGTGTAWFDDLTLVTITQENQPPPSDSALTYLGRALDIMHERSLRRDSVDWDALRSSAIRRAGGAEDPADTYPAIRAALQELGDHHSFLMEPAAVKASEARDMREAGGGSGPAAEVLDGRIGYVMVPAFSGGGDRERVEFAAEIQELIARVDEVLPCGWIVDLRQNGGGNMWPMLAGLGPLLGEGDAGFFVSPAGGRTAWGYAGGASLIGGSVSVQVPHPYELASGPPTIAVLTGRRTASSGEAIVTAFRSRPATRSFGEETAGLSTANASISLSDGAMMILTTSVFADRTGTTYGQSIEPDERVDNPLGATPLLKDDVVLRAMSWLAGRSPCRVGVGGGRVAPAAGVREGPPARRSKTQDAGGAGQRIHEGAWEDERTCRETPAKGTTRCRRISEGLRRT